MAFKEAEVQLQILLVTLPWSSERGPDAVVVSLRQNGYDTCTGSGESCNYSP